MLALPAELYPQISGKSNYSVLCPLWEAAGAGTRLYRALSPIRWRCYSARKIYYQKESWLSTSKWKILSLVLPPPQRRGLRDKFLPGNRLNGNHTLRMNTTTSEAGGCHYAGKALCSSRTRTTRNTACQLRKDCYLPPVNGPLDGILSCSPISSSFSWFLTYSAIRLLFFPTVST